MDSGYIAAIIVVSILIIMLLFFVVYYFIWKKRVKIKNSYKKSKRKSNDAYQEYLAEFK